jgi:hypothetical protein
MMGLFWLRKNTPAPWKNKPTGKRKRAGTPFVQGIPARDQA